MRHGTWPWSVLTVVSWIIIVSAAATSQGLRPVKIDVPLPPYDRPSFAQGYPASSDIDRLTGAQMVLTSALPSNSKFFTSSSSTIYDMRTIMFQSAWEENWQAASGLGELHMAGFVYRSQQYKPIESCLPIENWIIAGSSVAGLMVDGGVVSGACAIFSRGPTHVLIEVLLDGADHKVRVRNAIEGIVSILDQNITEVPYAPIQPKTPNARKMLLLGWLLGVLLVGLSTIAPMALDRAPWRRLANLTSRHRANPAQHDIENAVKGVRRKVRALGVARFALLMLALRATEELYMGGYETLGLLVGAYVLGLFLQRIVITRSLRMASGRLLLGRSIVATLA